MLNKKLMILTIILVSLLTVSAVSAEDNATSDVVSVDETIDDVISVDEADEVVSVEDNYQVIEQTEKEETISATDNGTFTALQNKINKASEGSTITLENDYIYNDGFDIEGIVINKSMTINGNGHTIDGSGKSRLFLVNVAGSNIIFNNIVFKNGWAPVDEYDESSEPQGAAIYFTKEVSECGITDCSFINNTGRYDEGSAVSAYTFCDGFISNCDFTDNGWAFGLNYDSNNNNISNCNFVNTGGISFRGDNNYASYLNFTKSKLTCNGQYNTISNCHFENADFSYRGGAISLFGGKNTVMDSYFINNLALYEGGAITLSGKENVIANSYFINNHADDGGAIYCSGTNLLDNSFSNLVFINNSADKGGVSYFEDGSSLDLFKYCIFINNTAREDGSVIYYNDDVFGPGVRNSIIIDNGNVSTIYSRYSTIPLEGSNWWGNTADNYNMTPNVGSSVSQLPGLIFLNATSSSSKLKVGETSTISYGLYYYKLKSTTIEEYDSSDLPDFNLKLSTITGEIDKKSTCLDETIKYTSKAEGTDYVTASYNGVSYSLAIENIKPPVTVLANDLTKYYGEPEKYIVTVAKNGAPLAGVNVKITVNGKTSTVTTDSKGQASIPLDLPVGTYDVESEYDGVKATSKALVKSTIATSDVTGVYSNSKVTAAFLDAAGNALASKQVTFKVGDKTYAATTSSNGAAATNVDLPVGTYTVTAVNPVNKEEKTFNLVINKAGSKISLTSSQINGVTTLTAALTPTTASGNVVFNVNGENRNVQINNGKAILTLKDLNPGNYMVTAIYNGDKNLNASTSNTVTFNVEEVYPILTAKDLTKTYGAANKFVVNLVDSKGNPIANAVVNVNIKGKITPITTGSNGQAAMAIGLAPGKYTAEATYASTAQATAKITIQKATPKLTAKAKTFKKSVKTKKYTVTLKTNKNKVMKKVWVSLKVNKKTYKVKTNNKGQATFKITNLKKKGKYTAVVKYAGSKYYNAKTVKPKITIK